MLKQHATLFRRLMIFADLCVLLISFCLAYYLRNNIHELDPFNKYVWLLPELLLIWGTSLYLFGMYASFRIKKIQEILVILLKAVFVSFMLFGAMTYLLKLTHVSRTFILLTFILTSLLTALEKIALMQFFRSLRRKGFNFRNILIVGTGKRAQSFIRGVKSNREFGFKLIGLVDQDIKKVGQKVSGCKVIGSLDDIPEILRSTPVDQVIFIVPRSCLWKIEEPMLYCEKMGVMVSVAVNMFKLQFTKGREGSLFGTPLITFETESQKVWPLFLKRTFDIVASTIALIFLAPFFTLIALAIKIISQGPVFFIQERVSLNGRKFFLYKFRTMCQDAESQLDQLKNLNEMKGPVFKISNDPRIIPFGKFLRKFSIDELPQIYNVLKGDMSIVGPRPPIYHEVQEYDHWQRRRLSMRSGITCLWQVKGRNKITDFDKWAKLDLEYIDNWSLLLDLKILFETIPVVLFGIGAK